MLKYKGPLNSNILHYMIWQSWPKHHTNEGIAIVISLNLRNQRNWIFITHFNSWFADDIFLTKKEDVIIYYYSLKTITKLFTQTIVAVSLTFDKERNL